ncbi:hypothetical protein L596_018473 [Steinernema carpocapsae]|uniref:BRCT domain-containing protein n=2 Tax=Steinernema carpocapsae TaxID=34508 RepID=A0A4U5N579_STECR|nr:hypothetical protein L596_018473 [Steinernema carpocapsae]
MIQLQNLFRRPNAAWKLQNASQAIVEEEEEEVKQHDDATTGSEDDRHDGTPSLGHEASLLEPIRAEVQVTAKKDGSVQAVAETKATEVQAAKSMRDSFAQATQFTKESSTQTTTEKYDQQIEGSSAELFGKVDVMELITQMKQVHQCDTMQAVTQLFPGLIAMLNNDGYLVAKPHEFHPLAEASLSYMTTQPLYGNPLYTVADNAQMSHSFLAFPPHAPVPGAQAPHGAENGERSPTDEGTLNLDDTYPMEMSDHPSLRPPIKISKDFGDSTLQNLEEEIPLDISVFTEGTKTHPGGHQITSTPLLPHVKALKGTESETPGVSPISRPNKSKRPKRNATRNLSSIMEMDEVDKQVSPVILKLQRGSSVTRDPGTQKVNWENCEFRVAGQSLEVIKEKSHCEPNPAENMAEPANDDYETVPDSSQGDEDQPLDEEVDCVEDSFRDVDAGETEELFDADKENFQPDKVNKIAILVVGKNTLNDAQFLARFSVAFPDVEVAENCSRNVTHIIIFDSDGRTNVNLSIHYVYALSHRIPAVTQQWLKDSIKEKRILDTRNYEIEEIRGMKGSIGAGRRSAEDRKRTLFRKFWFHVPEFVYESDNVSRGMLLEMIEACGGNIVEKPWDAKGARGCKLMIPGNIMSEYLREDALRFHPEVDLNYVQPAGTNSIFGALLGAEFGLVLVILVMTMTVMPCTFGIILSLIHFIGKFTAGFCGIGPYYSAVLRA